MAFYNLQKSIIKSKALKYKLFLFLVLNRKNYLQKYAITNSTEKMVNCLIFIRIFLGFNGGGEDYFAFCALH